MELVKQVAFALLPSAGIGFLFYKIMKLLLEGDRKERAAYARWQAEQDATTGRSGGADPSSSEDRPDLRSPRNPE